jgi:hypothetical protein
MNGFRVARIAHAGHDKVIDISWAPAEQHSMAGRAPMGVCGSGGMGAPLAAAGVPTRSGAAAMAAGASMAAAGEVSAVHLLSHPMMTRDSHDHAASTIVSIKRRKPGGPGGARGTRASTGNNHRPADSFVSHNILPSYAYGR